MIILCNSIEAQHDTVFVGWCYEAVVGLDFRQRRVLFMHPAIKHLKFAGRARVVVAAGGVVE